MLESSGKFRKPKPRHSAVTPKTQLCRTAAIGLSLLVAGAELRAQRPFAHNRLEFSNRLLTDRDDVFPHQATAGGVKLGDALFKVLPPEISERHGAHRISGYRMAVAVQRGFQGFFPSPVKLPSVQVFRTKVAKLGGTVLGFKDYDVPDFLAPATGVFDSIGIDLPTAGAHTVQVEMDSAASDPKLRQLISVPGLVQGRRSGLAIVLRGIQGESSLSPFLPTAVMRPSYLERHIAPGRDSYSGSFTAATGKTAMYGMLGQPSPRGELYLSLLFDNPVLSVFGSSAGGLATHVAETGMGPGAFSTDIATGQGTATVGFFGQAEQFHAAPGRYAFIPAIVSRGPAGPSMSLPFGSAMLRIDPTVNHLAALFNLGFWGMLSDYRAGGVAGFVRDKRGCWASAPLIIQSNPVLKNSLVWVQAIVIDLKGGSVETSNVVRLVLN